MLSMSIICNTDTQTKQTSSSEIVCAWCVLCFGKRCAAIKLYLRPSFFHPCTVRNPTICIPPSTLPPSCIPQCRNTNIGIKVPLSQLCLSQQKRTLASMVQQYPADKHPLFVHKAFNSGPAPVLIVPAVYLLGYFGPGAGPLQALSLLVGKAAFLSSLANHKTYVQAEKSLTKTALYSFDNGLWRRQDPNTHTYTHIHLHTRKHTHTTQDPLYLSNGQVTRHLLPQSPWLQRDCKQILHIQTIIVALLKVLNDCVDLSE